MECKREVASSRPRRSQRAAHLLFVARLTIYIPKLFLSLQCIYVYAPLDSLRYLDPLTQISCSLTSRCALRANRRVTSLTQSDQAGWKRTQNTFPCLQRCPATLTRRISCSERSLVGWSERSARLSGPAPRHVHHHQFCRRSVNAVLLQACVPSPAAGSLGSNSKLDPERRSCWCVGGERQRDARWRRGLRRRASGGSRELFLDAAEGRQQSSPIGEMENSSCELRWGTSGTGAVHRNLRKTP